VILIIIATAYIISRFERTVIEDNKEFFAETEEEKELIAKGKKIINKAFTHAHIPKSHAEMDQEEKRPDLAAKKTSGDE